MNIYIIQIYICITDSCPTRCNPMGCSLLGSSVHGILEARILKWDSLLQGIFLIQGFRTSLVAQMVKCLQCRRPGFSPWVGKIPWRRKLQSTPVLLPRKSHGQRSLVGYSPWGRKESDRLSDFTFTSL